MDKAHLDVSFFGERWTVCFSAPLEEHQICGDRACPALGTRVEEIAKDDTLFYAKIKAKVFAAFSAIVQIYLGNQLQKRTNGNGMEYTKTAEEELKKTKSNLEF